MQTRSQMLNENLGVRISLQPGALKRDPMISQAFRGATRPPTGVSRPTRPPDRSINASRGHRPRDGPNRLGSKPICHAYSCR